MKRLPRRLTFRPANSALRRLRWRPLDFKLDLNMLDRNLKDCFKLPPLLPGQTVALFDGVKLAADLRPMAAAFRVAPLLSPGYLEKLRAAQDAAQAEAIRDRQAWLDEASAISREQYLDLRLRSCLVASPDCTPFLVSTGL